MLPGDELAGFCPVCAWREFAQEVAAEHPTAASDALFAVADHDVFAEIGRGGGGIVYRARQRETRREVALKMLAPHQLASPEMRARFRGEIEAVTALDHPAILPVYAVGDYNGAPYFTMRLAAGGSLAERIDSWRDRWRGIATLVATLADAVHYAHQHGVIHRDLKPGNVLFDESDRPYVSDFGLAKYTEADVSLTRTHSVLGTPAYLAPECIRAGSARPTHAADIYSLGAILYELLTGRPPFSGESLAALLEQLAAASPPRPRAIRPDVPRDLEIVALRCLEPDPARRFPSARALADDLQAWLENRPIQSRAVPGAERLWRWAGRNPALAVLSVTLLLALAGGGAALWHRNRSLHAALERVSTAESDARDKLFTALLAEAGLQRQSGRPGQRYETLEVLERAAELEHNEAVRSAVAATLTRPDWRLLQEVTVEPSWFARQDCTVDFSVDLGTYVAPDAAGGFTVRRTDDGSEIRRIDAGRDHLAAILQLAPEGRHVAVGYLNGVAQAWSLDEAAPWWHLASDPEAPARFALHPSGTTLVHTTPAHAVNRVDREAAPRILAPAGSPVLALEFDADGTRLAVVRQDVCEAWDVTAGRLLWRQPGAFGPARPAWSADGRRIAFAESRHFEVLVCHADNGQIERRLRGLSAEPRFLAFHPDGRQLMAVDWSSRLLWWDALAGALWMSTGAWPHVLRFAADGRRVAASRGLHDVAIFELAPAEVLRELRGHAVVNHSTFTFGLSPDERWLASVDEHELRIWDLLAGREVWSGPSRHEAEWAAVHFAADGRSLFQSGFVSGLRRRSFSPQDDGSVIVGDEIPLEDGRGGLLLGIRRSSGDWWINRAWTEQRLCRWPGGDPLHEECFAVRNGWDRTRFSDDGRLAATFGDPEPRVDVWDTTTGTIVQQLPVTHLADGAFSPDGRWLLIGTTEEYCAWDVRTWQPGPRWPAQLAGWLYGGVLFSPAGDLVAVQRGRRECELRETQNFTVTVTLEQPAGAGAPHAWSADGNRLYGIGIGHRVYVWDLAALRRELVARGLDWAENDRMPSGEP